MDWSSSWPALLAVILGSGGLGAVINKWQGRRTDEATVRASDASSRKTDVDTLREIIAEVRASEAKKDTRIDSLEARLDKVEDRERARLALDATHAAWDALAYGLIIAGGRPDFPPPPPLSVSDGGHV